MLALDLDGMDRVGGWLARQLAPGDVVTLAGGLGAGKTTLARAVLRALGHDGEIPSPTFAIVQPYDHLPLPIVHADLYRLRDPAELEELGLEEAREVGALLIEWPDRAGDGAWPDALRLSLEPRATGERALTWAMPRSWEGRWPPPPSLR